MGAPGMEQGIRFDKYDVLLVKKNGTTRRSLWDRRAFCYRAVTSLRNAMGQSI